jgi:hypothetical protein
LCTERLEGAAEIAFEGGVEEEIERGDGVACGSGVGGIGFEEERRAFAAEEFAVEILRYVNDELDGAPSEEPINFGEAVGFLDDIEILGIAEGEDEGTGEWTLISAEYGGRKIPGV